MRPRASRQSHGAHKFVKWRSGGRRVIETVCRRTVSAMTAWSRCHRQASQKVGTKDAAMGGGPKRKYHKVG